MKCTTGRIALYKWLNCTPGGFLVCHDWIRVGFPEALEARTAVQRQDPRDERERRPRETRKVLDERNVQTERTGKKGIRTTVRAFEKDNKRKMIVSWKIFLGLSATASVSGQRQKYVYRNGPWYTLFLGTRCSWLMYRVRNK
jgi:hypothetical protein